MKTILITGGSEGLGYAIAKLLTTNNKVYLLARNEEKLKKSSKELNCSYKVCDVSDWKSISKAVSEIEKETSHIDILINNAGLWIQGPIQDNDPEKIREIINVNTLGPILMTKAVVPAMKKQKSGVIININSQAGLMAKAERSVYNASKWAITGFTKSMFQELIKDGIKVMGIYPSLMNTGMFEKIGITKNMDGALSVEDVAKAVEFMINQGEFTVFPEVGMMSTKY